MWNYQRVTEFIWGLAKSRKLRGKSMGKGVKFSGVASKVTHVLQKVSIVYTELCWYDTHMYCIYIYYKCWTSQCVYDRLCATRNINGNRRTTSLLFSLTADRKNNVFVDYWSPSDINIQAAFLLYCLRMYMNSTSWSLSHFMPIAFQTKP